MWNTNADFSNGNPAIRNGQIRGLIDLNQKSAWGQGGYRFKLAASGETVYVGKRAGNLFQSFDGGNSWRDITLILPLRFTHFKEIVFAGSTVYVATDTGVLASQNGEHWRVLTDRIRQRPVIDKLAVDGTTVYGAGDAGVYHLGNRGKWEQVSPSVPGEVISLAINNNTDFMLLPRVVDYFTSHLMRNFTRCQSMNKH